MKTVRRPPYPKWNPGYFPCSSLTPPFRFPHAVHRCPSVDSGLRTAFRTRAFWLIAFGHALSTMPLTTFLVHMGLLLDDRGLSVREVGLVSDVMALTGAVITPVGGILGDRFPVRKIIPLFAVVQMAGLYFAVLGSSSLYAAIAFAALVGIGWGGRAAPISSVRGTYFGPRSFAKITGFSMMPLSLMSLVSPWIVGASIISRAKAIVTLSSYSQPSA